MITYKDSLIREELLKISGCIFLIAKSRLDKILKNCYSISTMNISGEVLVKDPGSALVKN